MSLSTKRVHFVGIGGIGMSGLAHLLLERGYQVSGSDVKASPLTSQLEKEGATVTLGHQETNLRNAETLIYSSCIQEGNPEKKEAERRKLPVISRGELLSLLFKEKRIGIAIAGSHGKTTTTALTAYLLKKAGCDPTYVIGGVSHDLRGNAAEGKGDYFVAEADESDGSFLALSPTYSIVTNMDAEHLDYYGSLERSLEAYRVFLNKTKKDGKIFVSSDCPQTSQVLKKVRPLPVATFGHSRGGHYFPDRIERRGDHSFFDCIANGKKSGRFRLNLPGLHNIANALGVIALADELRLPLSIVQETLETFQGVQRRLEMNHFPALTIIEDYAHHPAEIEATLEALRGMADGRRIVGVFQPHRYTRTQLLAKRFGSCFRRLDYLIVTDIYAASEPPIPGVDAGVIVREVKRAEREKELLYLPKKEILPRLLHILKPKDILIVMGAGDVFEIARELAQGCAKGILPWINKS